MGGILALHAGGVAMQSVRKTTTEETRRLACLARAMRADTTGPRDNGTRHDANLTASRRDMPDTAGLIDRGHGHDRALSE